ncbi:MAG: hypothetical protein MR911_10960 [Spirochaetia bacterium]|nr:hypothetical protein [Spirochaetia bacterium]
MDILINNHCKDKCKVEIFTTDNNNITIKIIDKKKKMLADVKVGSTIIIGEREYVVLEHSADTTAVITKEPVKAMAFGEDGDYTKSYVREYCNGKFYKELCKAVGRKNIIPHTVNLVSDDGSNKGASVKDNVSVLTTDLYRRYRELLPAIGLFCWTATRVTTLDKDYARYVCCVYSSGVLGWYGGGYSFGVRPFCILNSSLMVNVKGDE